MKNQTWRKQKQFSPITLGLILLALWTGIIYWAVSLI